MEMDAPNHSGRVRSVQRLVYYISKVLHEAKIRYLEVHKLLYAALIASRKLRHYFQAHKISVVTSYPLRAILHNPNETDNIAKWAAELAEFELDFVPRHAVKSQVLADFIVDWTPSTSPPGARTTMSQSPELWSSLEPTGLSPLTDPHISRGPVGGGGAARHPTWGPVQVYGAPRPQSNQQHGGERSPALWVEYSLVVGGLTAPRERRLPAYCQVSQGRLLLQ
jgi:hypothetical protein